MVAVVAVSTAAFWPQELAAQECGHCHDLGLSDNEFRHWSHGVVTPMSGWGPGDGWHFYSRDGPCDFVHGICVFVASGDGAELVDPGKLVDEVATAVWEGDVRRLGARRA